MFGVIGDETDHGALPLPSDKASQVEALARQGQRPHLQHAAEFDVVGHRTCCDNAVTLAALEALGSDFN